MRKLLLIVITSLFLLTACSSYKAQKEVVFWTLQMRDFSSYINEIINDYEAQHSDIKIKWIDIPFSEGEKRTLAAVMTDNPPDLINLNPDFSAMLAQKGILQEISPQNLSEFNQEIVEALKYNGKLYSIPWYGTSAITIYNKELFRKSGLKDLPRTFDDLAKISSVIKNNTGAYSYLPTIVENDTMLKILNKYGVIEPADYNSKNSIEIFNMFKDLYSKDLIPPETITMTHREALEQYMAGKIVFYQAGANFLNIIKENAPSIYAQTDVMEQIKGSLGQNDFSVMNFVIPIRAKYKKEALDFCLYLTNEENQLKLAKLTNIITTNSNALKNEFYDDYSDLSAKARTISAKQFHNIRPAFMQRDGQKEINYKINNAVQEILLDKESTENILNNLFNYNNQVD
ncbi:extracellular solute-binding protein [bacterium]|nr:extracellular solute-binding protein [bacterium]